MKRIILSVLLCSILFAGLVMAEPWDKKLEADARWHVIWNGAAVLDRETGLVWQRQPVAESYNWFDSQSRCQTLPIGGRWGWHMPALEEMMSLSDPSVLGLPVGHPFDFSLLSSPLQFWTQSTQVNDYIPYEGGKLLDLTTFGVYYPAKNESHYFWCVRGGAGYDLKGRGVR